MQSSNPVFARSDGFNGRGAQTSAGYGQTTTGYTDPASWQVSQPGQSGGADNYSGSPTQYADQARMTVETVVHKTAFTLALVFVSAFVTWWYVGPLDSDAALTTTYGLAMGGAIIGFGLAMVNSFKKIVSPPLVIAYAVVEGVFVGAFSKAIVAMVGGSADLVFQAVLGTMAAFVGTLIAYTVLDIKVTPKFRKGVTAAVFGFMGVALLNFVMSFFGADFGFRDFDTMGLLISCVAVVLGVLCLILDFDFVERGVAAGLPESESWRAAFGLTVTLIWIYIEMLRILAIFSSSD